MSETLAQQAVRAQGMCGELLNGGKDICILEPGHGEHDSEPYERGVEEYLALRYADDPVEAFNLFIKAWVQPEWHGHLLDDDENDGEFVRGHIRKAAAHATPSLSQRMRDGAETIKEFNALCGMGVNCSISPQYMLREADRMDQ